MISLKEAQDKGLTHYVSGKACNKGHTGNRYVSTRRCVECTAKKSRQWEKDNRDIVLSRRREARRISGYCVYKAIYPSGDYIGTGRTGDRKNSHMAGATRIGKSLGEKAIAFKILVIGTREYCREVEVLLIDSIGLSNLLNKKRGG